MSNSVDDENQDDLPDLIATDSFSFTITNNTRFILTNNNSSSYNTYNNQTSNPNEELNGDYSFLEEFMDRILNSSFNYNEPEEEQDEVEFRRRDDDYTEYFSGAMNEIVSDYMNDYYNNNNNNIDYILSIYNRDTNNTIENILNQSFEEAPTLCKKENHNINLQQFVYSKKDNNETCTICLTDFEDGTSVSNLNCNHVFHHHCLEEWCQYKSQCPICRNEIKIN